MNCERNICYQQGYNGGCDTCPCNDELRSGGKRMKPQEAIRVMKIALAEVEWEYPMDYAAAFETAIEALEKQATTQATSEWILVSERLPENIKTVLVTLKEMEQPTIGWYGNIDGWRLSEKEFCCIEHEVIAWMPLPPVFKGE